MSLQTQEDGGSLDKGLENPDAALMKPLISYSREFLLSLSDSESCKKLPSGFDESLRREFEDALIRIHDRPRIQGSLSSQGFRRNEYGASPPTRGDYGNYSRGVYGKWESRSSLRSDRDSDSQSDKDSGSDSGRQFGPQSRRSRQVPEHDGLLGSGSFPRHPGVSASKLRLNEPNNLNKPNEPNQLNKTNEPYQPPRPYKAVPHSRRDTDSINDETFGSMEITSEDRAEAERRRRASFEMIRKEQHKALQGKQLEKHKSGGAVSDLCGGFMDNKEEKVVSGRNNELEVSGGIPISSNDLEKPFASHSTASRPLIPPGFKTNTFEKISGVKSLVQPPSSEVAKAVTGETLVHADGHLVPCNNGGLERRLDGGQPAGTTHPAVILNTGANVNAQDVLDVPIKCFGTEDQLFQASSHLDFHGAMGKSEIAELNAGVLDDKIASSSNGSYSTSILEKILGSTLSVDDAPSGSVEPRDIKSEDKWSLNSSHSSKFAQWFSEEEAMVAADVSSSMPNNLLSSIISGDKVNVMPDHVSIDNKEEAIPAVLTCEDLEQSILSEYPTKTAPHVQPVVEIWSGNSENINKPSTHVDNQASLHLLSLLHKSTDPSSTSVNSIDGSLADKPIASPENDMATPFAKPNGEEQSKTITLETLFGSAFMKELHSVGAPVSAQRGPVLSSEADSLENGITSSLTTDKTRLQVPNHDYGATENEAEKNWLGFNNFPIEGTSSKGPQFQLPEEENLTSNTPINTMEKVPSDLGSESSESLHFPLGPGIYRDMQVQQSPPWFQHQQMTPQVRSLLYNNRSEPHNMVRAGSQPKFLGAEPGFNHDPHTINHQIPPNMVGPSFHNPNLRVSGFDIPQHSVMHHQMQMPGNHPQQFPRGFIQEMNQVQGFRQPNTASRGMPMPGGNPPPDAFQRLMEMELRANSKQNPRGHNNPQEMMHGMMGMRYR